METTVSDTPQISRQKSHFHRTKAPEAAHFQESIQEAIRVQDLGFRLKVWGSEFGV